MSLSILNSPFFDEMITKNIRIPSLILITLSFTFLAGCNSNNSSGGVNKRPDSVAQPSVRSGESEGEGENGMDTIHRGMRHGPGGMDSAHQRRHE